MKILQEDINRFWNKIDFTETCWNYTGCSSSNNNKYGIFWIDGKNILAHRFSYIIHNDFKNINHDELVCHKCDNPLCVNPNHLFIGTHKINSEDMVCKNRQFHNFGEYNGSSILLESDVLNIIDKVKNNQYSNINQIVKDYNVSYLTINDIFHCKTWMHLTDTIFDFKKLKDKIIDKSSNRNTAKLTKADVYNIRIALNNGSSQKQLSKQYDVHITTIDAIYKYKTWKTVKI